MEKITKQKGRTCCVPNCYSSDNDYVTFHQFPKSGQKVVIQQENGKLLICERKKVWQDIVGIDQKITEKSKVCSLHFEDEDYVTPARRKLGSSAIPSQNLPEESSAFLTFRQKPHNKFNVIDHKTYLQKINKEKNKVPLSCDVPKSCEQDCAKDLNCEIRKDNSEENKMYLQKLNKEKHKIAIDRDVPKSCDSLLKSEQKCAKDLNCEVRRDNCEEDVIVIEDDSSSSSLEETKAVGSPSSADSHNVQFRFYDSKLFDIFLMHTKFEIENLKEGYFNYTE